MIGRNMATITDKPFNSREYWEKRLSEKWGLHGVGHISFGQPYNEWLYRVRKHVFLRHVRGLPVDLRNAAVLDIGSGTGFWLNVWRYVGVRTVVGSDLTHVAVENLRQENPGMEIREMDITDPNAVGEMKGRFDLISAFDVLFHITDEGRFAAAIANVASLLRPGGCFLFSDCFIHREARRAVHEVDRKIDDYTRQLDAHGLKTLTRVPVFVVMNTPIDSRSEIPQIAWRLFMAPVRLLHPLGYLYGAVLYPCELLLTKTLRESPSTEMMICQKPGS